MTDGLRFAFLTTFYPPTNFGGDGIGIQRLARGLVRHGHHVTVIQDADAFHLLGGTPPSGAPADDGVEVISLSSKVGPLSCLLTQQTGRPVVNGGRIRQLLGEGRFDVTNFHNVSLLGGPGLLYYGSDTLRLYMAHEHWLVCPTHVLWRHGRERCDGRQCLRCGLHYKRPPQLWRWTGGLTRALDEVDGFIAVSEFSRQKHKEFGFPKEMEVLNYFLPDPDGTPFSQQGESPHGRPYFLFVGRLEKIKGLEDVIPLFEHYEEADLVIAGDGEYADTLRAAAGDNPRVKFLGRLNMEELERYYRHALALVVPSVCFETFGIIIIEAFKYGTPVIARRLGPFPEILQRSGGGLLFDDAESLMAAMRAVQNDPAKRDALGSAGYEAFLEHWVESAAVPRYLDIVRRTAARTEHTSIVRKLEARV